MFDIRLETFIRVRTVTGPASFQEQMKSVTNVLFHDGGRVTYPLPLFEYGGYSMSASPVTALDGARLTLDLENWTFFDHERNRRIGNLSMPATDPNDSTMWEFVRFYVNNARRLDSDQLDQWASEIVRGLQEANPEVDDANAPS